MDRYIPMKAAAERLGLTPQRVLRLVKSRGVPAIRPGYEYLIREQDLALLEERPPGRPRKSVSG